MNKSQLFTTAHKIAKTLEGDYRARFVYALTLAWKEVKTMKTNVDVNELKAIQKMINENESKIWINKRIKKLELKNDLDTLEVAKKLTKDCKIIEEIESAKFEELTKDLKIVTLESSGNIIVKGEHKVLNKRLDKDTWNKVKHCFKFTNTREVNDEFWGEQFVGYEIVKEAELRKIMNF